MYLRNEIDYKKFTLMVNSVREIQECLDEGATKFTFSIKNKKIAKQKREIIELSALLKTNQPICSLGLHVEDITPEEVSILADGLASNTVLKVLNLRGNKINSTGAKYLNEALKTNTGLEELELTENPIGGYIDSCFLQNKTLRRLCLFDCKITARQAAVLLKSLENNDTLRELDLCKNVFGGIGLWMDFDNGGYKSNPNNDRIDFLSIIINFIKTNQGLTKIRLEFNSFNKYDLTKIAKSIEASTSLTSADLSSYLFIHNIVGPFFTRNKLAYETKLAAARPYTQGALVGMFKSFGIPEEVAATELDKYFDRQTGGRIARVNKAAAGSAQMFFAKSESIQQIADQEKNENSINTASSNHGPML